jgi:hypothetical protein
MDVGFETLGHYQASDLSREPLSVEDANNLREKFQSLCDLLSQQRETYLADLRSTFAHERLQNELVLTPPDSRAKLTAEVTETMFELTRTLHQILRRYDAFQQSDESQILQNQLELLRAAQSAQRELYWTELLPQLEMSDQDLMDQASISDSGES